MKRALEGRIGAGAVAVVPDVAIDQVQSTMDPYPVVTPGRPWLLNSRDNPSRS